MFGDLKALRCVNRHRDQGPKVFEDLKALSCAKSVDTKTRGLLKALSCAK